MASGRPSAASLIARGMLLPYAVALALIVWLPAPAASKVTGIVDRIARVVSEHSVISLSTTYAVLEFAANIALFVPLGLLLPIAWPRSGAWVAVLAGVSTSAAIELVQTLLPSRVASFSDVVANTFGAAVGCVLAGTLRRPSRRRRPPSPSLRSRSGGSSAPLARRASDR